MAVIRGGYVVQPHVQALADAIEADNLANSFGTYAGHDPSPDLAVDVFVSSREQGDQVAQFVIDNIPNYGVWYLIFWQRIYNPSIGSYWRDMEDRGSPTQNHHDHVHVSFFNNFSLPEEDPLSALSPDEQHELLDKTRVVFDRVAILFNDLGPNEVTIKETLDVVKRIKDGLGSSQ